MPRTTTSARTVTVAADCFTATKWSSAGDKAKFVSDLAAFVRSGFQRTKFTKALYTRLSLTFGHIAHFNIHGFYDTWFAAPDDQKRWLRHVRDYRPCGDPQWTFSDAEQAFQAWVGAK